MFWKYFFHRRPLVARLLQPAYSKRKGMSKTASATKNLCSANITASLRKLFLAITALSIFFISCNSSPNQEKNQNILPVFVDSSVQLFSKENPVINLNIKYINDAFKFEKQLGSKISYFPKEVKICQIMSVSGIALYDSIMRKPGPHTENPQYVIFHRPESYDFPLNVIYEYNPKTRIVSCINYEWAPHWIHYRNSNDCDTANVNNKIKYAPWGFYKNMYRKLFKLCITTFPNDSIDDFGFVKSIMRDFSVPNNLDSVINFLLMDIDNSQFFYRPVSWENENYSTELQITKNLAFLRYKNSNYEKTKYRGLTLSFFLKKNNKLDEQ